MRERVSTRRSPTTGGTPATLASYLPLGTKSGCDLWPTFSICSTTAGQSSKQPFSTLSRCAALESRRRHSIGSRGRADAPDDSSAPIAADPAVPPSPSHFYRRSRRGWNFSWRAPRRVDEYGLLIHLLILGSGSRFFADDGTFAALPLVDAQTTTTGVVIATCRRADLTAGKND